MTYKPINGFIVVSAIVREKQEVDYDFESTKNEEKKFRYMEMLVEMVGDVTGVFPGDTVHIDKANCFDIIMDGQTKVLVQVKNCAMINEVSPLRKEEWDDEDER